MSSKSASASSAKLAKVRADRDAFFAAGQYYEALQLYKTLISRARMKKDWALAIDTATEGAEALLAQGQAGSGGELALALLEIYTRTGATCGERELRTILELATAFPAATPDAAAAPVAAGSSAASPPLESTPFESKIVFLRAALKWSSLPSVAPAGAVSGSGHPDIHLALARTLRAVAPGEEDPAAVFAAAHQQYLRSGGSSALSQLTRSKDSAGAPWKAGVEYEEDCELLCTWAAAGSAASDLELDLFFARAALQYLCVEDVAGATAVLSWLRANRPAVAEQPLIHYASFVTEVVQRGGPHAGKLFDLLRSKYTPALSRDPALESYVDKIGEVFLQRQAQRGFMETLMSGMSAPTPAAAAAAASPSPAAPAAAAAAGSFDAPMASDVD